jgi:hypothetical protein
MKYMITENKINQVALKWLNNNFGDLTKLVKDDRTFYVDKDQKPLFYYYQHSSNEFININYDRIWVFLKFMFGMEYPQTRDVIRYWLKETYNLRGLKPMYTQWPMEELLEEAYNLKKK